MLIISWHYHKINSDLTGLLISDIKYQLFLEQEEHNERQNLESEFICLDLFTIV